MKSHGKNPNFILVEENEDTSDVSSTLVRGYLEKNQFEELKNSKILNDHVVEYLKEKGNQIYILNKK